MALTVAETENYLRTVAAEVGLPIMLYNLPVATGVPLSVSDGSGVEVGEGVSVGLTEAVGVPGAVGVGVGEGVSVGVGVGDGVSVGVGVGDGVGVGVGGTITSTTVSVRRSQVICWGLDTEAEPSGA